MKKPLLISALTGLVVGFISAKTPFNQTWMALIPWAIIGIIIVWMAKSKRQGIWNGAVYAAVLTDSFMLFNYKGGRPHLTFWIFVVALALFGLLVGAVGGWLIWKLRRKK